MAEQAAELRAQTAELKIHYFSVKFENLNGNIPLDKIFRCLEPR